MTNMHSSLIQQIGRSLFCLGLLIRYGSGLLASFNSSGTDVMNSLTLLKDFLKSDDFVIRVRSLQVKLASTYDFEVLDTFINA